jgi:DNA-binding transcriptional regulator YhcF (GntR family)
MTFAWMICRASWKPVRVRYKGKAISLNRGQLAISVRDLAEAMDRDKAWIERLFTRLKTETMIETHSETGVNIITICNYSQYQAETEVRETPGETPDETDARQTRDTEQEDKELKNTSEPKGSSVVETREAKPFALPDRMGIDPQHWKDFLANRKRKRLPSTATAYEGQLRALTALSDDEWPPGRLVQHAAEKGWGSINDPRSSGIHNGNRPANDRPIPIQNARLRAAIELDAERDRGQRYGGF